MEQTKTPEEMASELRRLVCELQLQDRNDLILQALGVPLLEQLRIEAARGKLSRLLITKDYRLLLPDNGQQEVVLQPVHKAVYLLFLAHPEGILMDEYSASYYIISSHTTKRFAGSSRIWYERLKVVNLPRQLVVWEKDNP